MSSECKRQKMDRSEEQPEISHRKDDRETIAHLVQVARDLSDNLKEEKSERKNAERQNEKLEKACKDLKRKLEEQEEESDDRYDKLRDNYNSAFEELKNMTSILNARKETLTEEIQRRQKLEFENKAMVKMMVDVGAVIKEKDKEIDEHKEENNALQMRLKFVRDNLEDAAKCLFCHSDTSNERFFHDKGICKKPIYCPTCFEQQQKRRDAPKNQVQCLKCNVYCKVTEFTKRKHDLHGIVSDCRLDTLDF